MMQRFLSLIACGALLMGTLSGCSGSSAGGNNAAKNNGGAAGYPQKAVSVVVPFSAGGGTDLTIRSLVDCAKSSFPHNITIENKTGGGGAVGLSFGANAKADGSVITAVTVELTTLSHINSSTNVNYEKFKPVIMYNSDPSVITVKADSKFKTLKDFVEYSKTNKTQIGNSGVGAIWHLAAAGLAKAGNTKFTYVPYDGASPAVTALLGNHIQAVSVSYPEVSAYVKSGNLRVIGVLADKRLKDLPDVPTAKEQGYDVSIGTWRGLAVPKETPDAVVAKLSDIFTKAAESDTFKNAMEKSNEPVTIMNTADFQAKMKQDDAQFETLINSLGLAKK